MIKSQLTIGRVAFTVVIPALNRSRLLLRALLSLDKQTFKDFEVVIVDDGSTEDLGIPMALAPMLASRLIKTGGRGGNFARNLGTDEARGSYVCYLDSDDIFLPDRLETNFRFLQSKSSDILVSPSFIWRGDDSLCVKPHRPPAVGEDISEYYFLRDQRFITSTFVIRTKVAQEVRWDENLRKVQDPDFMIRLSRSGYDIDFLDSIQTALFDDEQVGRLTRSPREENLRDWLARSDGLLTAKAKAAFEMSALAYEVSLRSRLAGISLVLAGLKNDGPKKLAMKTLYRMLMGETFSKRTAQASLSKGHLRPDIASFIRELEKRSHNEWAVAYG